jgi:hypothetical protein
VTPGFKALYEGPCFHDGQRWTDKSGAIECEWSWRWQAVGLFGLDFEDQPWALVSGASDGRLRWLRIAEMIRGAQ